MDQHKSPVYDRAEDSPPDLSIVIITWNQAPLLERCLRSIAEQDAESSFEVVVLDNGSEDDTREVISRFEFVRAILSDENLGVARGRNRGINCASGRYLMMLDDDTEILPGCVDAVVKCMDKHRETAWGAGVKTNLTDGSLQYTARKFYTLGAVIYRRTPLGSWFPNAKPLRDHMMSDWDHEDVRNVDWVSGSGYVMSREGIEHIGIFDEKYFFGFEDVDWCYRVHKAGKDVLYIPDARIIHHWQRSSQKMFSSKAINHLASMGRFLLKQFFGKMKHKVK